MGLQFRFRNAVLPPIFFYPGACSIKIAFCLLPILLACLLEPDFFYPGQDLVDKGFERRLGSLILIAHCIAPKRTSGRLRRGGRLFGWLHLPLRAGIRTLPVWQVADRVLGQNPSHLYALDVFSGNTIAQQIPLLNPTKCYESKAH